MYFMKKILKASHAVLSFINNIIFPLISLSFFLKKIYGVGFLFNQRMITGPRNINLAYTYNPRRLNIEKLRKCYTEAIEKS